MLHIPQQQPEDGGTSMLKKLNKIKKIATHFGTLWFEVVIERIACFNTLRSRQLHQEAQTHSDASHPPLPSPQTQAQRCCCCPPVGNMY